MADETIARARALAAEARDCENELKDLEMREDMLRSRLTKILKDELVTLMNEADVRSLGLPAEGNQPPLEFRLQPWYRAAIPKAWPQERKEQALASLPNDLIKVTVTIAFPRHEHDKAMALVERLKEEDFACEVERSVHHATLTSWVKSKFENGRGDLPDLETIGASMGQEVKISRND